MSIRQQGGVFGRNPTFNNVGVDGDLNVDDGTFFVDADTDKVGVKNSAPSNNFTVGPNTAFPWSSAYSSFRGPVYIYDPASSSFGIRIGHSSNVPYLQGYRETVGVTRLDLQPLGGDVQITNGNLIVANGKGIDFSATAGTGTSELFDDYEEGTWTPTFSAEFTTAPTVTSAQYTKIGRQVTVTMLATDGVVTAGGSIGGLPFASNASQGAGAYGGNSDTTESMQGTVGQSASSITNIPARTLTGDTWQITATYFTT